MPLDVERFKCHRMKEGVKPITVNVQLRHLRASFNEAVRLRLIPESPFSGFKFLPVDPNEAAFVSESDLRRLITVIEDLEFRNLVLVTFVMAFRRGEVINLRWADIDFNTGYVHIRSHGKFRTKGGKKRSIPLNGWVAKYLLQKPRIGEYVFSQPDGRPFVGDPVTRRFKRKVRKAGLDDAIHFHSLRHGGLSWMSAQGMPLAFVQRIAGHSTLRITQAYTHVEDNSLHAAMSALVAPSFN